LFRRQVNGAIPDEHISINAVRFEGNDIIEADMVMDATQDGRAMGPRRLRRYQAPTHRTHSADVEL